MDPGFPAGGIDPLGDVDLQCGCFSVKMYVKAKELGPVGGGVRWARPLDPSIFSSVLTWSQCQVGLTIYYPIQFGIKNYE